MKKNKIIIIFSLLIFFIPILAKAEFVYPFKEISKSDCRFENFDTLSKDCKKDFPILHTADYKKLKDDYNYRRVYTVLWGATYDYGWDVGYGSHQGVDIATSEGTPIYAIGDGTVKIAWEMTGRGKAVVIEHQVNGRKIYSNYAHMSKIGVVSGQTVKAGDLIGKVGHTGNSYGNHLHFQIDLDTSTIHPYYPTKLTCSDPVGNEMTLVNKGYCRDDLLAKTVDPLAFLESNGAIVSATKTISQIKTDNIKQVEETKIAQKTILSRAEIQKMEVEQFLKNYKINFEINKLYTNLALGDSLKITINIKDRFGKAYNGTTPDYINVIKSNSNLTVFPEKILILENGQRDIVINGVKKGNSVIDIKIGSVSVKKFDFFIYGKTDVIYGNKAGIGGDKGVGLGDKTSSRVVIYKDNTRLISVPYSGKYILKSRNDNILFCLKQPKIEKEIDSVMATKCKPEDYKKSIIFDINNTFQGTFYFDYKVIGSNKSYVINVLNWKTNKILGEKKIEIYASKDLDKKYVYYEEIYKFLKAGIVENKTTNYFQPDKSLIQSDGLIFINNILNYLLSAEESKSNKDSGKITKLKLALYSLQNEKSSRSTNLTRKQFFDLVYKYLILNKKDLEIIKYLDLTSDYRAKVGNIFNQNNTWKDKFGAKYFQPDKEITRGEAVYMLSLIK
ncbi:MAG: M23 family metallopeptidase [Candidatus Gracilibacteria bacterium]|nr:M23 family metallopeptidase [Candidatus Gracilibacteria bacterium]